MERVFSRQGTVLDRLCLPVERLIYRITAVDPDVEMTGKEYATCFVLFGFAGTVLLYGILRVQQFLPWFFPQYHTTPLSPDLALNTAISFSTTTTWQAYAGQNTMSYFSQMVGLCAQNFLAGAAGLAGSIARRHCARLAGRSDELPPLCGGHDRRGCPPGHTAGPCRRTGDHQESRHEWRRFL